MTFKIKVFIGFLSVCALSSFAIFALPGSATFAISQRFFSDKKLGEINGFSEWGALQFDAEFGVYRLPYNIEPLVGFGYIQGSASAFALDSNGQRITNSSGEFLVSSIDSLSYKFFTPSIGLRWKAWDPKFFRLVPFIQIMEDFRFGFLNKTTYAVDQKRSLSGFDLGTRFGGGLLLSFLGGNKKDSDIRTEWGMNDFGILAFANYLSGGQIRMGLGQIQSLSGWNFGAGLHLAW